MLQMRRAAEARQQQQLQDGGEPMDNSVAERLVL